MKDPMIYAGKAQSLIEKSKQLEANSAPPDYNVYSLILDTELVFFAYSENYPALYDLRLMKEKYAEHIRRGDKLTEIVSRHLNRFVDFLFDYQ